MPRETFVLSCPSVKLHRAGAVGLGTAFFYLAFLSPIIYSIDGISMLAVSESLVTHGSLAVAKSLGVVGRGGLYYSKWYPLLSFLALPLVAVGTFFAGFTHLPPHFMAGAFALMLPPVLVGATTGMVMMLASRLGASHQGSILAAIGFAFGTIALVYAREFFAEPLLALITVTATYFELGSQRERLIVGPLAALAVLAKPTGVIVGPILAMHAALRDRSIRPIFTGLTGSAAGIALYLFYNYVRFGKVLSFGQPFAFTLGHIPGGVAVLLASPARGLAWYCPAVLALAGLSPSFLRRLDVLMILSITVAYLGIYAVWFDSAGGWSWGPRLLLPALPGLMALCGLLKSRRSLRALVALTLIGFILNAPTLISYYERVYQEELVAHELPTSWSLSGAPILRVWGSMSRELEDAQRTDVHLLVQHAGEASDDTEASWRTLRVVAVWWWMLPLVRIPRALGAAVSGLIAITGLALIWRAWVGASRQPIAP
jgi:hypothetical protein